MLEAELGFFRDEEGFIGEWDEDDCFPSKCSAVEVDFEVGREIIAQYPFCELDVLGW